MASSKTKTHGACFTITPVSAEGDVAETVVGDTGMPSTPLATELEASAPDAAQETSEICQPKFQCKDCELENDASEAYIVVFSDDKTEAEAGQATAGQATAVRTRATAKSKPGDYLRCIVYHRLARARATSSVDPLWRSVLNGGTSTRRLAPNG